MKVGDRIRAKRQDMGMSVDELAARLGKIVPLCIATRKVISKTCR